MEPQVGLKEPFYFYPLLPRIRQSPALVEGRGCFPKVNSIRPHPWWVFITLPVVPCWDINTGMQCGPFL